MKCLKMATFINDRKVDIILINLGRNMCVYVYKRKEIPGWAKN